MKLALVVGALVFSTGSAAQHEADPKLLATYSVCPGQDILKKASDISWGKVESMLAKHETLRRDYHALIPTGTARILWYAEGGDLETTRFSVIAVRDAQGLWHSSGVGESVAWIQGAKPTPMNPLSRDLTAEESRALDKLLEDPCLYAEPTFLNDPTVVAGGLFSTLEVEIPGNQWRGSWHVLPTKQESAVIDLIGTKD